MSAHCCPPVAAAPDLPRYRRVLLIALLVNAAMFGVELAAGVHAGSVALLADAIDFAGDALNYGASLLVLAATLAWRARMAMLKAACMIGFGVFVAARAAWGAFDGTPPDALTMSVVGLLALLANLGVAGLLYAWRHGDANMRSVWLCTRNDALGNLAVLAAALGVFGSGTAWPDLAVAAIMSALAIHGGAQVLRQATGELRGPPAADEAATRAARARAPSR